MLSEGKEKSTYSYLNRQGRDHHSSLVTMLFPHSFGIYATQHSLLVVLEEIVTLNF